MADFKTHITVSTVLGVGYAGVGFAVLNLPPAACILAGGLCSVSGMLPDLDSDSGVPVREMLTLSAAVVPMLMLERFEQLGLSHESMVLAGAAVYLAIRFLFGWFLKRYTVHRGMFHSLPAGLIFGLVAYLICQCPAFEIRLFKAGAVMLGFFSHLVLDELWAIEWKYGRMRLKSSFGTALKVYSPKSLWANVSTYAKLVLLTYIAIQDPVWMRQFESQVEGEAVAGHNHDHHVRQPSLRESPGSPASPSENFLVRWLNPQPAPHTVAQPALAQPAPTAPPVGISSPTGAQQDRPRATIRR